MNIKKNNHKSVLIDEIIKNYHIKNNESMVFDGTFGGGGYSRYFLEKGVSVFACDLDQDAIDYFIEKNSKMNNLELIKNNFSNYISTFSDNFFDLIVLDLGYSTNQLDYGNRGFSYLQDGEIFDLRYDNTVGKPVYQKIQTVKSPEDLGRILFRYSGESFSHRIAVNLYNTIKKKNEIVYNHEVVSIIEEVIPKKFVHKKNSILSRVWQGLRIWVNDEFTNLELFLDVSIKKLKQDGQLMIVSFNSLEDKIVTNFMRKVSKKVEIDNYGNTKQYFELVTKKAILPTVNEIESNRRSRSAMLRILKKL